MPAHFLRDLMDIRLAKPSDAAAIANLGRLSFTAKFGHLYKASDLDPFLVETHGEPTVAAQINDPQMRVLLAEADGQILGYCKLVMQCGWPEYAQGIKTVELKQLYTHPEQTGRGIGAELMDRAIAEVHAFGGDEIQLSVYSENPGAQKFYGRYGFRKVADIHFMVGDHRDEEFLYAKLL